MKKYLIIGLLAVVVVSCSDKQTTTKNERWYTPAQVSNGATLFKSNCASCHGGDAQGLVANWKKPLADDSYPPPPLNGSGHAWHHPMKGLKFSISEGGVPVGGKMPPFKDKLNGTEIDAVIAYFQSKWDNKVYNAWKERNESK